MNCGVKDYNSMSEDKAGESKTVNFEEQDQEDSTLVPLLSEYSKKLESRVKRRYIEKKSVIGIDPATLWHAKLDPDCLPPIEATDLLSYLILDTSYYTAQQSKAFKSLEAYNQMVSGFITSVQGKLSPESTWFLQKCDIRSASMTRRSPFGWFQANKEQSFWPIAWVVRLA